MPTIIQGRPDYENGRYVKNFGITRLKRHPPYVFGKQGHAKLVHKVAYVELDWYQIHTRDSLLRLDTPNARAITNCGMTFFLSENTWQTHAPKKKKRKRATLCALPEVDAVMCGRCHGEPPTFGRNSKRTVTPQEAMRRLACMQIAEAKENE